MLKKLGLCASFVVIAACNTTSPALRAAKPQLSQTARQIVGTELIGAKGATDRDQDKIDDAVAGLCGAGSYTANECERHGLPPT